MNDQQNSEDARSTLRRRRVLGVALLLAAGLVPMVSCLGEPDINERWTVVEFIAVAPAPGQALSATQPVDVSVTGRITYRDILTGFLVAEVRYSDTIAPNTVFLDPQEANATTAEDIDLILANSVTAGRATQAVTGFDHLMQDIELAFTAQVPGELFDNANRGLYLILYMGEGDEIRRQDGTDSLVVTPFISSDYEVLHTGFALAVTPPRGTP